jgi:ABC-type sugar transport system ATPase subunit
MRQDIILQMENISKTFPGVKALDEVSLKVAKGEVHAIMGENGAGKSTLIKVLAGAYKPDSGSIFIDGKKATIKKPADALDLGISVVYQEQNIFIHTPVTENIFINQIPLRGGLVDYKTLKRKTKELMEKYKISHININKNCGQLSVGQQQLVEILRVTSQNVKILVLDEPTSALTEVETKILYSIIEKLKAEGISVIYISHRIQEILDICDRVTIMRDGRYVDTKIVAKTNKEEIVSMMVGRQLAYNYGANSTKWGEMVLRVENMNLPGKIYDVSFDLHAGEVLGIAGLEGSGRTEILESIFGLRKKSTGYIYINGKKRNIKSPITAKQMGIAYITKERKRVGLFMRVDVAGNIIAASLDKMTKAKLLNHKKILDYSNEYVHKLDIKTPNLKKLVMGLSGGNQQKVLLAMWLIQNPQIMLIDEPTRGIDVGTKEEIHRLIRSMARQGTAVLMVSSDMPEILGASDRVLTMYEGRLTAVLQRSDINENMIIRKISGLD